MSSSSFQDKQRFSSLGIPARSFQFSAEHVIVMAEMAQLWLSRSPSKAVMKKKLGLAAAVLISLLPFNVLRCAFYRLLAYSIKDAQVGVGTVIYVRLVLLEGCTIGRFNRFVGVYPSGRGHILKLMTHSIVVNGRLMRNMRTAMNDLC